ncbi:hypothetical protein FH972_006171 [Carpinus fangiana]|uniref:KOW domain-containing protein n=1 Tax=Carpinus fangiana TaxID=176857 RepID=A0A5N6QUF0_9ROSI|nr:hypothetical protein FH972_006171 [Carpinus fangiana]
MALRAAVGTPGAALGGPHERPLHKPVWPPEAVHTRRGSVDRHLRPDYQTLDGHRVAPRRSWLVQAQGRGSVRVWRILDVANNMTQGPCRALVANLTRCKVMVSFYGDLLRLLDFLTLVDEGQLEMGWKAAQKLIRHWKILRGDNVMITRGKDKGEMGVIKRVIRSQNRVIVEGKNLVKKHIKQGQGHEGGIFTVEAPLHVSNVQVLDPVTGKPCKVGVRYLEDGTKVRVSRGLGTSESIIPRPEILKIRTTPRPTIAGPKDTPMDLVLEKTYDAKTGKGVPEL